MKINIPLPMPHKRQQEFIYSNATRRCIRAGRRGGKSQPLTVVIYTPSGPVKMGNIRVGDKVLTPYGNAAIVEEIHPQGCVEIYRVAFGDGTSTETSGEHLWEIEERRSDSEWRIRRRLVTTSELMTMATVVQERKGASRRPSIPVPVPVQFDKQCIPLDPYLMGLLLGDGSLRGETLKLSSVDEEILATVREILGSYGMSLMRVGETCDYRLICNINHKYNPIIRALRKLHLWNHLSQDKFIPDCYKYNSEGIRLEVIRGILDTDGSADSHGQPKLEQTSERLAKDFAEVIQSLGGLCTLRTKMGGYSANGARKETRLVYRQVVLYHDARRLFRLGRKQAVARPRANEVRRFIHSVTPIGKAEAQCIKISDPRGLYLTDNFISTHNTTGMAILAVEEFLKGKRILYCSPTQDQVFTFWNNVNHYLEECIGASLFVRNLTLHSITKSGTDARIRARTAFNEDTLRGDWADLLIFDEYQLMSETAFDSVGAPMLADRNGTAIFVYTPPSLRNRAKSQAKDPQHAAKLFKKAQADTSGRWAVFTFPSMENPHISRQALDDLAKDMSHVAFQQEIMALDIDEAPGALWNRKLLDELRVTQAPELVRIITSVDPSASSGGDEAGIVTVGLGKDGHLYVLADDSLQGSPAQWAHEAVSAYHRNQAGRLVAEKNQGGEMIRSVIAMIPNAPPVKLIHASDNKQVRAEPVAVVWEQRRGHMVGTFPRLEDELTLWQPGGPSPNRMDAMCQACAELLPNLRHMPDVDYHKSGLQTPLPVQYVQPVSNRVTLR